MIPEIFEPVSLQGQVALVTGAGLGLGRAAAFALAQAGAVVAANDLTPMNVESVVADIQRGGGTARAYVEELTRGMPVRALVDRVVEDMGRLDVLVNGAVVKHPASLLEMDEWDWLRTLDVNLSGPFLLMQAAAGHMRTQGGGVIVNFTIDGLSDPAAHGQPAYFAGKSGLAALSRASAQELMAYNIRVHAICSREVRPGESSSPPVSSPNAGSPQSHKLISQLILHLCSPAAARLTGQIYRLDGE